MEEITGQASILLSVPLVGAIIDFYLIECWKEYLSGNRSEAFV